MTGVQAPNVLFDSLDQSEWQFNDRSFDKLICKARNLCNYETDSACGKLAKFCDSSCL
jgi:hypothetical protein